MAKKKKILAPTIFGLSSAAPQASDDLHNEPEGETTPDVPKRLFTDYIIKSKVSGDIPKVDEGYSKSSKPDLSTESLKSFYSRTGTEVFVKTINSGNGTYLRFEFGAALDKYRVNVDGSNENTIIKKLSCAKISKRGFINNLNLVVRYINYFINWFDDDDELMAAYLRMMTIIHLTNVEIPVQTFIEMLYSTLATSTMVEKVISMVEYNADETLIKKTDRQYDESIQLTVEHLKAIMGLSCFHKFTIPIVNHYCALHSKEVQDMGWSDRDLYYEVFQMFIPLFDDYYDINLYEKLYHTASTRISKTENSENLMWKRRDRFGVTPTSYAHELMRDLLTDISYKMVFNISAIIFIHVCFDNAIKNELIQKDAYDMSDMEMTASDPVNERISRFDRWQIDCSQHSERDRLCAYVSIKDIIYQLGNDFDLRFYRDESSARDRSRVSPDDDTQKEYEYYMETIAKPLSDTQLYLIHLYVSKALGDAEDGKNMDFPDIIKIIMIMKRDLRSRNYAYLPFFISGKLNPTATKARNKKNVEKLVVSNPLYEDWIGQYPDTLDQFNLDKFYGELKTCISCPIIVVEHDSELAGNIMTPSDIEVADEWCRFMYEI